MPGDGGGNKKLSSSAEECIRYVTVGIVIFAIDILIFNALLFSRINLEPITSKLISGTISTSLAFYMHFYWTFGKRDFALAKKNQVVLFSIVQAAGIAIAVSCLWVSHYILDFRGILADNLAANAVGLALATIFRFYFNSRFVYRKADDWE